MKNDEFPNEDRIDLELSALIDLGMQSEALKLAAAIIDSPKPRAAAIFEAIHAVGIFARRPMQWKHRIEKLLARIGRRTTQSARESFLLYFASINDYPQASKFIKSPRSFTPQGIYLAVEALLHLGRIEDADLVVRQARIPDSDDDALDFLSEAVALVRSATGDHEQALHLRRQAPCTSPIARNIVEGAAKSAVALAIQDLDRRLAELQTRENDWDETCLSIPGNEESRLKECRTAYRTLQDRYLRHFSKDELHSYRLDATARPRIR